VLHGFMDSDTVVDVDGHIGHGAVLHGCRIERDAMVGMHAVIMDDAVIGESSIVGASSFVRAGLVVPSRSLVIGTPARIVRALRDDEIAWKRKGTMQYHELTERSMRTMQAVPPLAEVENDRPRVQAVGRAAPKIRSRNERT
jgi:phenylacetic acid degradation protein